MARRLPGLLLGASILTMATPAFAGTYTTGFRWDAERRLVGMVAPDPDGAGPLGFPAERYTYDADGKLTLVEKGVLTSFPAESVAPSAWSGFTVQQQSAFAYDARGFQTETRVSSGGTAYSITHMTYDADGRLSCQAVRMDLAGAPAAGSDACLLDPTPGSEGPDRISKTIYDAAGQTLQVRKAVGASLEQAYATYAWSANGKQTVVVDANGNRAEMVYDGYDRKTKWIFPSTTPAAAFNPATPASALASSNAINAADYEQYGYDANDNRISLRKRDASTLTYDYDALNRMTVKVVPSRADLTAAQTRDVFYGYDLRGLQLFARFDSTSGDGLTSTYDKAGRLTSSTLLMGGVSRQLGYGHDLNSNRTSLTFPDAQAFSFNQDALNRMTGVYEGASFNSQQIGIGYNAAGQRSLLDRTNPWDTLYEYDPVARLSALVQSRYGSAGDVRIELGRNSASQIVSRWRSNDSYAFVDAYNVNRNYSVNGLNQYTATSTGASYQYDLNGNLTADGSTSYKYDIENRLVSATGANSATLSYDPMGRLYEVAGAATTRFLYDGDALVAEYDGSGTMLRRYVHGSGVDEPLIWYEGGAISPAGQRFLHADHQGSIIHVSDASGATTGINAYDEYGIPGAANIGRFQYTGQIYIPELGMYHYKARAYSPTLGRFMQTDPIGYDDQVNLYAYVGNDPMNGRDPKGTYGRGTGFNDDKKEWERFDKAQQKMAGKMEARAEKALAKAAKLDAKGKSGGDRLRTAAANLSAGAAKLRDTSDTAPKANLYTEEEYARFNRPDGSQAFTDRSRNETNFSRGPLGVFGKEGLGAQWVIGHEGLHHAGLSDQRGPNGALAYKGAEEPNTQALRAIRGTNQAAINPDSLLNGDY